MLGHFKFRKQTLAFLCVTALLLAAVPVLGAAAASVNTPVTIPNGDMESASGWKDTGSGSASTTLEYVSGGHSGKALSVANTSANTWLEMSAERVAVEPGATYTLSAWIKGATSGTRLPIYIYEYAVASGGSVVKQTTGDTSTVYYASRGWQQISMTVTLQETTNYIRPRFTCTTPANGAYLIDEIVLIKVTEETEPATTVELIDNGDMSKASGWNVTNNGALTYEADGGHDGQALKVTCTDPTPDVTTDTYDVNVRPANVKVVGGTAYAYSAYVKVGTGTRCRLDIVEYNAEGGILAYQNAEVQILYSTDGWVQLTHSFTASADAASVLPQVSLASMNNTREAYIDDISLTTTVDMGESAILTQNYDDGVGTAVATNAVSGVRKNTNGTVTLDPNGVFPDVNGVSGAAAAVQFTGTNNQALFRPVGTNETANYLTATANTDYIFRAKVKASAASTAQLAVLRTGTTQVAGTQTLTVGEWNEIEFAFNTSTATSVWPQIVLKPTTAATTDAPVVFMVDDIEIVAAAPYCADISVYTAHGIVPEKAGSVFIGWYSDAALTTAATAGAAYAKFMTAAEVGAATLNLNGTAIRNTTDLNKQGLYFRTVFENVAYLQHADIVEFGLLMLPENLLGDDAALTLEDTRAAKLYADKPADITLLKSGTENMTGSLSNAVAGTRFQRQIAARPYALLADGTAMYGNQETSSVAYVASTLANMIAEVEGVDSSEVTDLLSIDDTALTYDQTTALIAFCVANYQLLDV